MESPNAEMSMWRTLCAESAIKYVQVGQLHERCKDSTWIMLCEGDPGFSSGATESGGGDSGLEACVILRLILGHMAQLSDKIILTTAVVAQIISTLETLPPTTSMLSPPTRRNSKVSRMCYACRCASPPCYRTDAMRHYSVSPKSEGGETHKA